MKHFLLYIKSHTDAPDFEDILDAETKEDAVSYWYQKYDLDKEFIDQNSMEEI
jgi:hypothetical protein